MILITFSILSSITYYLMDFYKNYDNTKLIFKFLSIILLINQNNHLYNGILTSYSIGDVTLKFSEKYSLIFFGIGHSIFIYKMMEGYLIYTALMTPILLASSLSIYITLEYKFIHNHTQEIQ